MSESSPLLMSLMSFRFCVISRMDSPVLCILNQEINIVIHFYHQNIRFWDNVIRNRSDLCLLAGYPTYLPDIRSDLRSIWCRYPAKYPIKQLDIRPDIWYWFAGRIFGSSQDNISIFRERSKCAHSNPVKYDLLRNFIF